MKFITGLFASPLRLDLVKHFFAGLVISLIVSFILNPIAGVCVAALMGAGKEAIWDGWMKRGVADINDLFATIGGGAVSSIAFAIYLFNV
jgi:hypothetical protein